MANGGSDVLVIGAGVSGLTTAICLLEAGLEVTVRTADLPQHTTSAVAGAVWGTHLVGGGKVRQWAALTLDRLRLLGEDPAAGIRELRGLVAVRQADQEPPGFTHGAGPLARCDPGELPVGFAGGWRYRVPVATMPVYLDYLTGELIRKGGDLHVGRPLGRLAEAARSSSARVIVNCAGLGARELVPDPALVPVRGQVVTVANPGLSEFFVGDGGDPDAVTYIFPHGAIALLGGTTEHGNASTAPDPAVAARILRDCAAAEPRLAGAAVLAHRVGLRPVRPQVRLEPEELGGGRHVVHNYGHGGAGLTLSWGCAIAAADEVIRLLGAG